MLSVLIPTYNYNVYPLVQSLINQLSKQNIPFEVIVLDDGSDDFYLHENQNINILNSSKFLINKKNLGLSTTRNLLIKASQYNYVLLIDGDSIIFNTNYIEKYLESIKDNSDIVYGGRIHPPLVKESYKKLRWKYGKVVEDKLADIRKISPYKTLMFNNTLIKKEVLNKLQFNSKITKYGHEDTLLAYQISIQNLKVSHIDNPVKHGDIDDNKVFLSKTISGLNNLKYLYKKKLIDSNFITLLHWHKILSSIKLQYILRVFYKLFKPLMVANLESRYPSLTIFKMFKISYFCYLLNTQPVKKRN